MYVILSYKLTLTLDGQSSFLSFHLVFDKDDTPSDGQSLVQITKCLQLSLFLLNIDLILLNTLEG